MADHEVAIQLLNEEKNSALDAILATNDDLETVEQQITTLALRKDEYITFINAKRVLALELGNAIEFLRGDSE